MPVEIREVIIRAEVTQAQQPSSFAAAPPSQLTPEMKRQISNICAEEIKQAKEKIQGQMSVDRFER
ncbi:DUF5908 family protein [Rubritalea marina]|uniref:DUF5908 family protein n=1 Tax=Rubritalea marina TaxID=361055 RepID=UPI0003721FA9|nr:DUF5908 family protein [Rubritalea marina]